MPEENLAEATNGHANAWKDGRNSSQASSALRSVFPLSHCIFPTVLGKLSRQNDRISFFALRPADRHAESDRKYVKLGNFV